MSTILPGRARPDGSEVVDQPLTGQALDHLGERGGGDDVEVAVRAAYDVVDEVLGESAGELGGEPVDGAPDGGVGDGWVDGGLHRNGRFG